MSRLASCSLRSCLFRCHSPIEMRILYVDWCNLIEPGREYTEKTIVE